MPVYMPLYVPGHNGLNISHILRTLRRGYYSSRNQNYQGYHPPLCRCNRCSPQGTENYPDLRHNYVLDHRRNPPLLCRSYRCNPQGTENHSDLRHNNVLDHRRNLPLLCRSNRCNPQGTENHSDLRHNNVLDHRRNLPLLCRSNRCNPQGTENYPDLRNNRRCHPPIHHWIELAERKKRNLPWPADAPLLHPINKNKNTDQQDDDLFTYSKIKTQFHKETVTYS